jgi:hypothetical protein
MALRRQRCVGIWRTRRLALHVIVVFPVFMLWKQNLARGGANRLLGGQQPAHFADKCLGQDRLGQHLDPRQPCQFFSLLLAGF